MHIYMSLSKLRFANRISIFYCHSATVQSPPIFSWSSNENINFPAIRGSLILQGTVSRDLSPLEFLINKTHPGHTFKNLKWF